VDWKKVKDEVEAEYEKLGESGRFGAGLPRINDGSLLFLQHMISKMKPVTVDGKGGSRIAIVFNGSPLFTGAAESGESRIRQWILENDWLEGIVALPDQLFYNTGISTYFWILTNRKSPDHRGKVVLLDARDYWAKMRKSLGDKRKYLTSEQIADITRLYTEALQVADDPEHPLHGKVKVFNNEDFGYRRITVERPLKLRFEVTEETLALVRESKPIQKALDVDAFEAALKPLLGRSWQTKGQPGTRSARRWPRPACSGRPARRFRRRCVTCSASATRRARCSSSRASPNPTRNYATTRTCLCTRTSKNTCAAKSSLTSRTPGSTTPRPRSATRYHSPDTSTSTSRRGPSPRSTQNSRSSKPRSKRSSAR
jgi:hypothetical protein